MFNLFGSKTVKGFEAETKETYTIPEPAPVPKQEQKEFYRVGRTDDGCTTLTMLGINGYGSMTLTMSQSACKQMIRMLESTFDLEQPFEETQE